MGTVPSLDVAAASSGPPLPFIAGVGVTVRVGAGSLVDVSRPPMRLSQSSAAFLLAALPLPPKSKSGESANSSSNPKLVSCCKRAKASEALEPVPAAPFA